MKRFYTFIFRAIGVQICIFSNTKEYLDSFCEVTEALKHLSTGDITMDTFIFRADNEEEALKKAKEYYKKYGWNID